jgi:hypothetical protein
VVDKHIDGRQPKMLKQITTKFCWRSTCPRRR